MVLMLVVVCAYTLLIYAASFYLTDANGVMVVSVAAADLLGGAVVLAGLGLYSWGSLQRSPEK